MNEEVNKIVDQEDFTSDPADPAFEHKSALTEWEKGHKRKVRLRIEKAFVLLGADKKLALELRRGLDDHLVPGVRINYRAD